MYDSITSHIVRLIRRRWPIFLAAVLLGATLGWALAARQSTWSGKATIQVVDPESAARLLGLSTEQVSTGRASVVPIAVRATEDFDASELAETASVSATPNDLAGVIVARGSGPDEATVELALAEFAQLAERRATEPRLQEVDAALAAANRTLEQFRADADDLTDQLAVLDAGDDARAAVVDARTALLTEIRELERQVGALDEYRTFLSEDLVAMAGVTYQPPSSGFVAALVGAGAAGVLAVLVAAAWVLLDGRVRRRLQVERIVPGAPILGVVPAKTDASHPAIRAARLSVERFATQSGSARVEFVDASNGAWLGTDPLSGAPVEQVATAGNADPDTPAAYVVVATWGKTTEQDVGSTVAALESAGPWPVGVLLVAVPPRDLDWAGATGRGADPTLTAPEVATG